MEMAMDSRQKRLKKNGARDLWKSRPMFRAGVKTRCNKYLSEGTDNGSLELQQWNKGGAVKTK